ncbi:MAG: hypothetical protein H6704_27590 [Myxococcales bacterium]|nr:hypothetical protein [Myxococcales bacterium]
MPRRDGRRRRRGVRGGRAQQLDQQGLGRLGRVALQRAQGLAPALEAGGAGAADPLGGGGLVEGGGGGIGVQPDLEGGAQLAGVVEGAARIGAGGATHDHLEGRGRRGEGRAAVAGEQQAQQGAEGLHVGLAGRARARERAGREARHAAMPLVGQQDVVRAQRGVPVAGAVEGGERGGGVGDEARGDRRGQAGVAGREQGGGGLGGQDLGVQVALVGAGEAHRARAADAGERAQGGRRGARGQRRGEGVATQAGALGAARQPAAGAEGERRAHFVAGAADSGSGWAGRRSTGTTIGSR